jgi:hypothetical protein
MSKLTYEQAILSADTLEEKLRKVIEEHFGQIPGTGEFTKSVEDTYILGEAATTVLSKVAIAYAMQSAKVNHSDPFEELTNTIELFNDLFDKNMAFCLDFLSEEIDKPLSN